MPGRRGTRAKPPTPCVVCGKKIDGPFLRTSRGDTHLTCRLPEKPKKGVK